MSWARMAAIFIKELQQMLRDKMTFGMAVGVPIIQLVLFGYAINMDPKGLPTAVVAQDHSDVGRSLISTMQTSGYFRVDYSGISEAEADAKMASGEIQFIVVIPDDFKRRLVRGEKPVLLVAADATDPSAAGNALAALSQLADTGLKRELVGPLANLQPGEPPFELRLQRRYNPEGLTRYNIVPGLIGTILTMTMVMLTSLAMTRERERGTMENLLATPVRPLEVMIGKILPYVMVGYIQLFVIVGAAELLFQVPMLGSFTLLLLLIGVFIDRKSVV